MRLVGDPIAEHMLLPHLNIFNQLTWEDVYRDWPNDDLKYYWESLDNPVLPRDYSYLDKGFDEAVQMAKDGNDDAKYYLRRIVRRDPESPQGKTAASVLS